MMSYYSEKRVLVPGGAGFVGSNLVGKLLGLGAIVTVLDNFQTGSRKNFDDFCNQENLTVLEHDITRPVNIDTDVVFNLACPASPVQYQRHPIETLRTSVIGADNLLMLCKNTNARLVHASTSEVYGDPAQHPQTETYWGNVNPNGLRACYDEGKRAAEALAMDYFRTHAVDLRIARIFNTYGPRMAKNDGRVVSNFIVQALQGNDVTVYGDGSFTRSFCFIDDMVTALLKMGMVNGIAGKVINLGNPLETSVLALAHKIIEITNSKSAVVFKALPSDDPTRRNPDITKAKKFLNWQPKVELHEGLVKTIGSFKEILGKS